MFVCATYGVGRVLDKNVLVAPDGLVESLDGLESHRDQLLDTNAVGKLSAQRSYAVLVKLVTQAHTNGR